MVLLPPGLLCEAGEAELLHGLATGNDGVPGKSGEGLQESCHSLGDMITKLQTHLPLLSYLVSETHVDCGETSWKHRVGASPWRLLEAGAAHSDGKGPLMRSWQAETEHDTCGTV